MPLCRFTGVFKDPLALELGEQPHIRNHLYLRTITVIKWTLTPIIGIYTTLYYNHGMSWPPASPRNVPRPLLYLSRKRSCKKGGECEFQPQRRVLARVYSSSSVSPRTSPQPQRVSFMNFPVYRQNADYDDWEVASVYDSDDCDSLGRSASDESSYRSDSLDDPAYRLHGLPHGDTRPRADYLLPQLQHQHQNYPLVAIARSRQDTRSLPGKRSDFSLPCAPIVPPPGMIFPRKDWVLPPQDMRWPSTADHTAPSSDMPLDMVPTDPPASSLLLSPSSPPRAPPPQIRRASPTRTIGLSQAPYTASVVAAATGAGLNVNIRSPPIMSPPPRSHEAVHTIPPRLADAGFQVHSGMTKSPRRPGHDVLSYSPEGSIVRGPQADEEMRVREERYGNYGPRDRPDLRPPPVPSKFGYEHEYGYDAGRSRSRPPTRERRPSIWQRFVRRFSQSRGVSIGHT